MMAPTACCKQELAGNNPAEVGFLTWQLYCPLSSLPVVSIQLS